MTKTTEHRFEEKVDRSGGPGSCHLWMAARYTRGHRYGMFVSGEKNPVTGRLKLVLAHRWAYEHYVGPIPDGLHVLHRCDNPPCVNPAHLVLGTHTDNMADMVGKGRQASGEHHPQARVTEDNVREIRRRYTQGERQGAIAIDYGITKSNVSAIVRRVSWAHVD